MKFPETQDHPKAADLIQGLDPYYIKQERGRWSSAGVHRGDSTGQCHGKSVPRRSSESRAVM